MKKEHTQQELVVLSLASHGEWRKAYELERQYVGNEMIGSEADTRLYEIFDKYVTDSPQKEKKVEINGAQYTVETKKDGNRRVYRAYLSRPKMITKVIERDGHYYKTLVEVAA